MISNKPFKTTMQRRYERDKEAIKFYNSKTWKDCRLLALIRDYYICQDCLKDRTITAYDVVDHIKPMKQYPELALVVSNLRSLCHKHHNRKDMDEKISKKINIIDFEMNPEII